MAGCAPCSAETLIAEKRLNGKGTAILVLTKPGSRTLAVTAVKGSKFKKLSVMLICQGRETPVPEMCQTAAHRPANLQ